MTVLKPKYRVELIEKDEKHFYGVYGEDGQKLHEFPSVTGILDVIAKPALIWWSKEEALKCVEQALRKRLKDPNPINFGEDWIKTIMKEARARPDKLRDDAADLGTRAHEFIDLIIKGKEPTEIPAEIKGPVLIFKEWWKDMGIEFLLPDTPVASLEHHYGGKIDALGRYKRELVLFDWKTGKNIYQEAGLQAGGGYAQGFYETYGLYVQRAFIVRFDKKPFSVFNPDKDIKEVRDLQHSLKGFLAAKQLSENLALDQFIKSQCVEAGQ